LLAKLIKSPIVDINNVGPNIVIVTPNKLAKTVKTRILFFVRDELSSAPKITPTIPPL
jgi:hypothetical protein